MIAERARRAWRPEHIWQQTRRMLWPHGLVAGAVVIWGAAALTGLISITAIQIGILALSIAWIIALRRDAFTAAMLIVLQIFFDWYQLIVMPKSFPYVSLLTAVVLVGIVGWEHRRDLPWVSVLDLALWGGLLTLGALAIPRSLDLIDAVVYFLNVLVTAFVFWLLGHLVITNRARLRQLLLWLSVLATLIGLHTIIEGRTGAFLLATPHLQQYLAANHDFLLDVGGAERAGSFLFNPDSNGAFLALMLFIPAGLLFTEPRWWAKLLHAGQIIVMLLGLLYTYTTAAWLAAVVGVAAFVLLAGRLRVRIAFFGAIVAVVAIGIAVLPQQFALLFKHATGPNALTLRKGGWQTALCLIQSNPLGGIGLGTGKSYLARDVACRSPLEFDPLPHPHNSFLELAVLAGLPVLLVYVALLTRGAIAAGRTYLAADWTARPLLAGVIAGLVALSVHALADATWTLPPLVPLAWLLLGAMGASALRADLRASQPDPARESAPLPTASPPTRQWVL